MVEEEVLSRRYSLGKLSEEYELQDEEEEEEASLHRIMSSGVRRPVTWDGLVQRCSKAK